jgi:hypothetical protein
MNKNDADSFANWHIHRKIPGFDFCFVFFNYLFVRVGGRDGPASPL